MSEETENNYYWPAYVDFMTVLFFIALGIGGYMYYEYAKKITGLKKYENLVKEAININEKLKREFKEKNISLDTTVKDKIKLKGDFYFAFDEADLKDTEAKNQIIAIGNSIKNVLDQDLNLSKYTILIEGHTDSDGGEEYNNNLSFQRALFIAQLWKTDAKMILPNYEIIPAGFGELKPLKIGNDEISKSINRRIEISIIPKMSEFTKLIQKDN